MAKQSGSGTRGRPRTGSDNERKTAHSTRKATSGGGGRRSEAEAAKSRLQADSPMLLSVTEAEVVAVEAHPKYPAMYRLAIRLHGDAESDAAGNKGVDLLHTTEPEPGDWSDEVDALIAGAAKAASADKAETVITVHEDTLVTLRLLKGRRLSAEEWDTLRREESREDAYRSALAILERKARTSRELSEALKRKGYAPDIIRSCLERLQARRMLDDSSYAKRFAEQRVTGHRKGRRLIRQELLQRGITREDADRALGELDGEAERQSALLLARKKWPQVKGELRERKQKLAAFLLRRGYPNDIVNEALREALASQAPSDDPLDDDFVFDPDEITDA